MLLCDSNVWLALVLSLHAHHRDVQEWLATIGEGRSICVCRATQQSLLRLLTTASVTAPFGVDPLTNREAWQAYEDILADDRVVFQDSEPRGLEACWRALSDRDSASPKVWMDTYLASFAIAGGYRFVTMDKAFKAYPGLDLTLLGERPRRRES